VMLNSTIELKDNGTTIFYGSVFSKEIVQSEGETALRLSCPDPLWKLKKAAAVLDGKYLWTRTTPPKALTSERLREVGDKNFWPEANRGNWLDIGDENTTTLGANIDDAVTTIKAATVAAGFGGLVPSGFIKIDDEWIWYDGYNDDGTDWYFYNCIRGVLQTAAAAHNAAATITQRTSMKIHPGVAIHLERWDSVAGKLEDVSAGDYTVQLEEGFFGFGFQPIAAPYTALYATYGVFNEDDPDVVILSDVIEALLKTAVSEGGPGLEDADIDIDIDEIRLTRVRADQPMSVFDAIEALLAETGLKSGADTDAIGFYYDHSTKKVCVKNIIQKDSGSEDHQYFEATQIDSDFSLEDVSSAIVALYSDVRPVQLACSGNTWFFTNGDLNVHGSGADVACLMYMDKDGWGRDGWNEDAVMINHKYKAYKLFDGLRTTGVGVQFDADPAGTKVPLFYFWFGDETTPVSKAVDRIEIVLDPRRVSSDGNPFDVEVVGYKTVSDPTTTPPTVSGETALGGAAQVTLTPGFADDKPEIIIEISEIGEVLQGIGIKYGGVSWDGGGAKPAVLLKQVRVYGRENSAEFIQITDDTAKSSGSDAPLYMYAPESYAKIVDAAFGQHHEKTVDFGAASRNAAISLARLTLLQSLVLWNTREYVIPHIEYVPQIGETVLMPDGYSGVVLGKQIELYGGTARLQLRVLDFGAVLV